MLKEIINAILGRKSSMPNGRRFSHIEIEAIVDVIESCDLEERIDTAIGWIHRLYRKNFFGTDVYHELMHLAIRKEKKIIREKLKRDIILPHVKKRADEIIQEERNKNIRLVKTPAPECKVSASGS